MNEKVCDKCGHTQKITTKLKQTKCSSCDGKIKLPIIIIGMLLFISATAILPGVYAENINLDVPFVVAEQNCTVYTDAENPDKLFYRCFFANEVMADDYQPPVLTPTNTTSTTGEPIQEEESFTEIIPIEIADKEKTSTQIKIEQLEEKIKDGTISSEDRILYELLVDMSDTCEIGVEHGERIQKFEQFELPIADPRTAYKSIDYSKNVNLGNIIKKIEECKHWDKYRVDVLGARYLDLIVDDSTSQGYHANVAEALETYPHDKITEHDFVVTQQTAKDFICTAVHFDGELKRQTDCPEPEGVISDTDVIIERPNPLDSNPVYKDWKQYVESGGALVDMNSLKKQEVNKALKTSLETFALLHGIDIADLKNLVQGDKP